MLWHLCESFSTPEEWNSESEEYDDFGRKKKRRVAEKGRAAASKGGAKA